MHFCTCYKEQACKIIGHARAVRLKASNTNNRQSGTARALTTNNHMYVKDKERESWGVLEFCFEFCSRFG
jgi:hypothetical protein